MISWLFEIDSLRLSTKDVTWSTTSYSGVIIPDSFSGITMRWDISGNGLIAPNEMEFEVSNTAGTYTASSFDGKFCTIMLIEDGANTRTWKFKIDRAISYYGKITCYCVDFLQEHLTGDYPNTKSQKEIWSSDDFDGEESESDCVPVVLGTAYIPVKSVNTGTERWYVLGESGPTYTVHEVMSPRSWPNSSTWLSSEYTMTGGVNSGYQLLQPIIADSDDDDIADAVGLWKSGDTFYDMLCKFSRNDTASLTNPADWIEYILEDFGVSSSDIDAVSFGAAATLYSSLAIVFNGGGWWEKESRESVLSNILAQTDSFLKCTDKVELYQFDATPVETITDVLLLSFSPSKITKSTNDSGRVHWPESTTSPSDVLNGKATVPSHNGGAETTTSSDILECRFLSGDSISAQKAGILYFQKKFEQSQKINFSVTFQSLSSKATISPGQVVTINNAIYGGSNNVIITDMTINPDMRVDCSGIILNYLEDWGDLTTTAKDVVTDSSLGFQLATTNYNGEIEVDAGADWETNLLNIPDRFKETASLGINVTDSYLGYHDGTDFQVFIQNNGNVQFGNPSIGQGFTWNQATGVCTIRGSLTIVNPADVRTTLNVADGADVTSANTSANTNAVDGTAAATVVSNAATGATHAGTAHAPSNADKTTVTTIGNALNGQSLITTGVITNSTYSLVLDFDESLMQVNNADGLIINSAGGLKIAAGGGILFLGKSNNPGSLLFSGSSGITSMGVDESGLFLCTWPSLDASNNGVGIGYRPTASGSTSSTPFDYIYTNASFGNTMVCGSKEIRLTSTGVETVGTITPSVTNTYNLGSTTRVWSSIYATTYYGDGSNLTGIAGGYTHPTHPGDDFSVDSGALTGATVISDIDINVTTDTLGHVTDANGVISTRTLTLADLGYSGYSAGTNLSLSGTTFNLVSSPSITSLYVADYIYHTDDTNTAISFLTDTVKIVAGGIEAINVTSTEIVIGRNIIPTATNTYDLGSLLKKMKAVHAVSIYRNGTALDVYDDLYELSKIQSKKKKNELGEKTSEEILNGKGMPITDPLSLPLEFTNYDDVVIKLKNDNYDLITQEDIDVLIQDDDEAGWMLTIDFGLLSDLTTGAVRQLDADMISMFNLLADRITVLENNRK